MSEWTLKPSSPAQRDAHHPVIWDGVPITEPRLIQDHHLKPHPIPPADKLTWTHLTQKLPQHPVLILLVSANPYIPTWDTLIQQAFQHKQPIERLTHLSFVSMIPILHNDQRDYIVWIYPE